MYVTVGLCRKATVSRLNAKCKFAAFIFVTFIRKKYMRNKIEITLTYMYTVQ